MVLFNFTSAVLEEGTTFTFGGSASPMAWVV
jgi:hypothetical protein